MGNTAATLTFNWNHGGCIHIHEGGRDRFVVTRAAHWFCLLGRSGQHRSVQLYRSVRGCSRPVLQRNGARLSRWNSVAFLRGPDPRLAVTPNVAPRPLRESRTLSALSTSCVCTQCSWTSLRLLQSRRSSKTSKPTSIAWTRSY